MAIKMEVGTWTGSGSSPQTVTLADGSFGTPQAIIAMTVSTGSAPSAGSFAGAGMLSVGFGTRRGGTTQEKCSTPWLADAADPTNVIVAMVSSLLSVTATGGTLDYDVNLSSFASSQFTVTYSSAANASGDVFKYIVFGGLDDAIVLEHTLDSTGATEIVTGAGFQGTCVFGLMSASVTTGTTVTTASHLSFGCATSSTAFWCQTFVATDNDSMTSTQNWNRAFRTDAFMERLTIDGDTSDARWDLNSFDSDGLTLGVVDAPTATNEECALLILKGATFEAGSKAKATGTGNDTFTLANSALTPVGVILGTTRQTAVGVSTAAIDFSLGAGSTPNATRGSAVNWTVGVTAPEADPTTVDRFRATDSVIEELTGGGSPAETSEAWFDAASAGSFVIDWAVNGGSAALIGYLAVGDASGGGGQGPAPKRRVISQAVKRAANW